MICRLFTTDSETVITLIKQSIRYVSLCVLLALLGSSEPDGGTPGEPAEGRRDCIPEPSGRGYAVLDEQILIVGASGRHQYH